MVWLLPSINRHPRGTYLNRYRSFLLKIKIALCYVGAEVGRQTSRDCFCSSRSKRRSKPSGSDRRAKIKGASANKRPTFVWLFQYATMLWRRGT